MNPMCSSKEEAEKFLQAYNVTTDQIKRELIRQNSEKAEADLDEEMAEINSAIAEDDSRDLIDPWSEEESKHAKQFYNNLIRAKNGDLSYDMVQIALKMQCGFRCSDLYWHSVCAVILSN